MRGKTINIVNVSLQTEMNASNEKKEKKTEQGQTPSKMLYTESLEINARYLYF